MRGALLLDVAAFLVALAACWIATEGAPVWQVALLVVLCLALELPGLLRRITGGAGKARAFAGQESPRVPRPPRFHFPRSRW